MTRHIRRVPSVFLPALVAWATLFGAVACGKPGKPAEAATKDGKKKGPPPALVVTAKVRAGTIEQRLQFLAQVQPKERAELAAAVGGLVQTVAPRVGDRVKATDVVVTLDRSLTQPNLDAARASAAQVSAELEQARREVARAKKLAHPIVTNAEKERLGATVATLRARLRALRAQAKQVTAQLDKHDVVAPFDGVIRARNVDPGNWVNPGQPLLELVSVDRLEVIVDVPAYLKPHLRTGGSAKLQGSQPIDASIKGIVPALEARTRTMRVRLEPDAATDGLMAGMAIDVEFSLQRGDDEGVLVSRDALVRGALGARVFKIVDGKASPVQVEVLVTSQQDALVRPQGEAKLAAGDTVAVRGNERLRPGQAVREKAD